MPGADGVEIEVWYSTSDPSNASPTWVQVAAADIRGYSVSRGRSDERSTVDAGTATILLNNRARLYDPYTNVNLRPMNRWRIRTRLAGVTQDRFVGYADSYRLTWPEQGNDSVTEVRCSDELKILNLQMMPAFDPPDVADYPGVVGADEPTHYWRWSDNLLMTTTVVETPVSDAIWFYWRHDPDRNTYTPQPTRTSTTEGGGWRIPSSGGGYAISNASPIVGEIGGSAEDGPGGSLQMVAGNAIQSADTAAGDMLSLNTGSVEMWLFKTANPGANSVLWASPDHAATGFRLWTWTLNTSGTVSFASRDSGGATQTVTSPVLPSNSWHHLVAVRNGSNLIIYVNGSLYTSVTSTVAWGIASETVPMLIINGGAGVTVFFDEMAVYPGKVLSAGRVAAHYTAGTVRGYVGQTTDGRVDAVLNTAASVAGRSLMASARTMYPAFMSSSALDMIRAAESCEMPDGVFFCSRSGTLTLLNAAHRSSSPYNTPQMVFDDDGTDQPYLDASAEKSDALIANLWQVTKSGRGAITQTVTDATSVARYRERAQAVSSLPVVLNADAATIAAAFLAKYKDPLDRIPDIKPNMSNQTTAALALARDLGDQIRIIRRPLGGGLPITQTAWIQAITEAAVPGQPVDLTFTVSPV